MLLDEKTRRTEFPDAEVELDKLRAGAHGLIARGDDRLTRGPTRESTPPHIKHLVPPVHYA